MWSLKKVEYLTSTFDVEISGVSQNQLAARPLSTCFLCSAHHQSLKQEKNLWLLVLLGKEVILIQRPAHIQVVQTYLWTLPNMALLKSKCCNTFSTLFIQWKEASTVSRCHPAKMISAKDASPSVYNCDISHISWNINLVLNQIFLKLKSMTVCGHTRYWLSLFMQICEVPAANRFSWIWPVFFLSRRFKFQEIVQWNDYTFYTKYLQI